MRENTGTGLQVWLQTISFPEHARSQVKGGHSSGEIELIRGTRLGFKFPVGGRVPVVFSSMEPPHIIFSLR